MKFEVGKKYNLVAGSGTIEKVICRFTDGRCRARPVCVETENNGHIFLVSTEGKGPGYYAEDLPPEWKTFAIDDPVMVSNDERFWYRRYFAGNQMGRPSTWVDGQTKWSSGGRNCDYWAHCRRPTKEEMEG